MIRNRFVHVMTIALYALLLWWPLYTLLAYMFLEETLRVFVPVLFMGLELALGGLLVFKLWNPRRPLKPVSFGILAFLLVGSLVLFVGSLIVVYGSLPWGPA